MARPKRSKFRNVRTTVDGITFASKLEAARYCELQRRERMGAISALRLQVPFTLQVDGPYGSWRCRYVADFVYHDADGQQIVEDTKGVATRDYKMKRALMRALHGIEILETRANERR